MPTKRSKKMRNVDVEADNISSQDKSYDSNKDILNKNQTSTKTPEKFIDVTTPKRQSQAVLQDMMQTPRRSCRKSVMPAQDYDDIVKRSLRSCTRSGRKALSAETENVENNDGENLHPKWTVAEVGRVSQKRGRKSKRTERGKNQNEKNTEQLQEDTCGDKNENDETDLGILKTLNDSLQKTNQIKQNEEQVEEDILGDMQYGLNNQDVKERHGSGVNNEANFESHNISTQLIPEDSEDDRESTDKSGPEEICIIYEKNISNENNTLSKSPKSVTSADKEDSFGCYLKSREINMSDLGLNPIGNEDDEDEINLGNHIQTLPKESEEMPSLIICDDDDEKDSKQTRTLNETFEANENAEIENCQIQNEELMEVLQLSDDDFETPKKCPRIVLTDTNAQSSKLLSSIKRESAVRTRTPLLPKAPVRKLPGTPKQPINGSALKVKLPSTPKIFTPKFPCTPQQSKKVYRIPTPYRNRNFKLDDEIKENIRYTPKKDISMPSLISLTTLEPREIVLRGIRKRSLSVCINEQQRQNVLVEPLGKQKQNRMVSFHSPANQTTIIDDLDMIIAKSLKKRKFREKESSKNFVTTRRKRSLSLDESFMSSIASKLPRPVVQNVASTTKNPSSSKTLKRTKLPNFAAIHEKHFNKMENLVDHVSRKQERSKNLINSASKIKSASAQKNISLNKSKTNNTGEKSRALKKIDLNPKTQKIEKKKSEMPKKPAFNLSTSLITKSTASASNFLEKANTSRLYNDNKLESRLQRHMDLFKGRAASAKTGSTARKNEVILKGVRSNRRFELQMQHRKNLEQ